MAITINNKQLQSILEKTPSHHNIMLVGVHGIGKSRIISEFFRAKGIEVITLFLGQMSDPGDLIGLPHLNTETGRTEFMPPYWFPKGDKPIVLFLDELNRARPEMLQSVMDLALNRMLAGRRLPEGSRVISAVNDGAEYQITELDPALVSRFNVYFFRPTVSEWLLWAEEQELDERVIHFIENNQDALDAPFNINADSIDKCADRRAWERVSDIMKGLEEIDELTLKLISGIVGVKAAARLAESLSETSVVSGSDLLLHFGEVKKRLKTMKLPQLALVNDNLFRCLEARGYPEEEIELVGTNLEKYILWLDKNDQREALMHLINNFSSATYPSANLTIMTKLPAIYTLMTDYLRQL